MSLKNPAALEFLQTRRSRPAKTLVAPAPTRDELLPLLMAAARSPDHGKLEPWRFIVLEKGAMPRLSALTQEFGATLGKTPEEIAKARSQFDMGHLAVAVIEVQKPSEKVPAIEQTYSAGAVCLALLNAALAAGWGANWLSGWQTHNPRFCQKAFGLKDNERVVGLVHIATEGATPPERPRPDVATLTEWVSA
ncbi:nitroreductase family protein [Ruegeria halocynthiae]|uniref:nitroreductase family protein n=1 Tax=Ruegeria halocynthiae TaxID=985054 RepID=UPI00055A913E|nr:nitroreductase [Ruegeria halocynthiae]